jgi:hypothetical protein
MFESPSSSFHMRALPDFRPQLHFSPPLASIQKGTSLCTMWGTRIHTVVVGVEAVKDRGELTEVIL